ncbi:MAG: hypothetical protein ABFQ65_01435 [Nanoarchaeota archaeon]
MKNKILIIIIITFLIVFVSALYSYKNIFTKEIYPFETDNIILKNPKEVSKFTTESGLIIEAASDQLLVYFREGVSDEEIKDFVNLVHDHNGYIVGQIPNSKIVQIKIKPKETLLNLKKELGNISYIKLVAYNRIVGEDIFDE